MMWVLVPLLAGVITTNYLDHYFDVVVGIIVTLFLFAFIPFVSGPSDKKVAKFFLWPIV